MIIVDDNNYDEVVSSTEKLIIIDFFAEWCGPCKTLGPILEKLEGKNLDVVFAKVDVDSAPELSRIFQIRSIPTMVFIKDSVVVGKINGASVEPVIQEKIDSLKI